MILSLGDRVPEIRGECFVAETAAVIGSVILEHEASVWFGAVVRGDNDLITIGAGTNIQDGAVLHTDPGFQLTLAPNVLVGHQAMVHGCTVGEGALIGIQSVILNGAKIGRNCIIGAQALIPEGREIPDNSLVVGTPGKVVRQVSPEEAASVLRGVRSYIERAKRYRTQLKRIG